MTRRARASLLHKVPPGLKLIVLAVAGTALAFTDSPWVMGAALVLTWLGYALARVSNRRLLAVLRPMAWLLAPLFLVQGLMQSWDLAFAVVGRIVTLVALANLVTVTTTNEAMIAVITRALTPFRVVGVHPAKVAFAISLSLRFLPVIGGLAQEVRDAQRARGLGNNPLALALPLLVRTLRMANDVTEAIEARSTEDEDEDADASRVRATGPAQTTTPPSASSSSIATVSRSP